MGIRPVRWPDERDTILDHLQLVYGPHEMDTLANRHFAFGAPLDPDDCLLIEDDAQHVIALGLLASRQIQIGPSVLSCGEIAVMSVAPEHANAGHQQTLLDALHTRMSVRGDVLGMAFGAPEHFDAWQYEYATGLYFTSYESVISTEAAFKAGKWSNTQGYERRMAQQLGMRGTSVTVRRFYLNDLPAINALYGVASAAGHYLIARDEPIWTTQLDHLAQMGHCKPDDFLVAETNDGLIVGYMRTITNASANLFRPDSGMQMNIIEVAARHPDAIEALLQAAGSVAHGLGQDQIGLFVHPASPFMQHALAHGASLRHFTGAGLLRLHNLTGTLDALVPTLDERRLNSRFNERAYRLVVTTENAGTEIFLGQGDPAAVEIEIPSSALVQLITGWQGTEHLPMAHHERHSELLSVLFPARQPMIAIADVI